MVEDVDVTKEPQISTQLLIAIMNWPKKVIIITACKLIDFYFHLSKTKIIIIQKKKIDMYYTQ